MIVVFHGYISLVYWSVCVCGIARQLNKKGADQTAWMRRLVCAFVVRNPPKPGCTRVKAHFMVNLFIGQCVLNCCLSLQILGPGSAIMHIAGRVKLLMKCLIFKELKRAN